MPSVWQDIKAVGLLCAGILGACLLWFSAWTLACWPLSSVIDDWAYVIALFGALFGFLALAFWAVTVDQGFEVVDRCLDGYMRWVEHASGGRRIPDYVPLRQRLSRAAAARWLRFRYRGVPPHDRFLTRRRREAADRRLLAAAFTYEQANQVAADSDVIRERAGLPPFLFSERLYVLHHELGFLEFIVDAGIEPSCYGYHVTQAGRDWAGLQPATPRRARPSALA